MIIGSVLQHTKKAAEILKREQGYNYSDVAI